MDRKIKKVQHSLNHLSFTEILFILSLHINDKFVYKFLLSSYINNI